MPLPQIQVAQLTLTNRCQCNCEHCGVASLREVIREELTASQIDGIYRDLRLAGCQVVDLFGGEPTLRHDLCEIIQRGKAYGFIVSLETNGYLLDQAFVRRLEAAGLDQIYLSLDDYRGEYHDRRRGREGCFARAVRALELGAKTGIVMHVSVVPQTTDFFVSGDINRFMQFVLEHGAERVRLLLPRFVGRSIRADGIPLGAGQEKELFSHVSAQYQDRIYVHTPGTPLGERNVCTAKNVFCHIMSNGWVAPCPYFPLVFGDATREPIVDIFERIQSHPLVRLGGEHCPMRNPEYIDTHIRKLGPSRPFYSITVQNHVDLGAACPPDCPGCAERKRSIPRPAEEVVRELRAVEPEYCRVEFYGGDAFLRDDLLAILDHVPPAMEVTLWTTCRRGGENAALWERLRSYRIGAIRVLLPLGGGKDVEAALDASVGLAEILKRVRAISSCGLPVHLYVPMDAPAESHVTLARWIHHLGAERVYTYTREPAQPLPNSFACFGRGLGRVRLVWAQRDRPARPATGRDVPANPQANPRVEYDH
ncbi:MAG TPA: radical SAM protein [Candidatus Methylomirabilis sp.]|nr:radical SAM protein [Candidatus Methylomirabilis sp.]